MDRDRRTSTERCLLCGTPAEESTAERPRGSDSPANGTYCSSGCREIDAVLEPADAGSGLPEHALRSADADGESADYALEGDGDERPETRTRTFLRIDGMHSALCEAYLESIAESQPGVSAADASYVTEAVRVDHDPERVSAGALEDALSTTGYTAYHREEATGEDGSDSGPGTAEANSTRRSREMQGMRKRRSEDLLEIRYIIGIVFGSFLLVPYVTVFYPVYLAAFSDYWLFEIYGETFATFDGMLFLPIFAVTTGLVLYLTGMPLLRGAYVSLKLRTPSTHLLAALTIVAAYGYGTLAFVLGDPKIYYDLTVLVAASVMAAVFYEERVKRTALNRLTDLTESQVGTARVLESDGATRDVPVADVTADDRLLVRAGERIPVDGTLIDGECTVDEAVVTGESLPVSKSTGDAVVGGSVVTGNAAVVAVGERTHSSLEGLTRAVWNLQSVDHGVQRRADGLATIALPLVLGAVVAAGLATHLVNGGATAIVGAVLLTIIVASPWALALATPCSVASSIRDALEAGIVVFDESVFERLRAVDVVVFDKTGTLTSGEMAVLEADAPPDLLAAAGTIERRGSHPAATAIADAFTSGGSGGERPHSDGDDSSRTDGGESQSPDNPCGSGSQSADSPYGSVEEFQRHATGVEGVVDGQRVLVGHPDCVRERGWVLDADLESRIAEIRDNGHLPVVVGRDGRAEGLVVVGDEPRAEWAETVTALDEHGIEVVVLTGDDDAATARFRAHSSVGHVFANVPPAGKTAAIRRLCATDRVAMVGDGTNDAPALAAADLGISLGGGTALAADAADLAIVEDDLGAVERAFALAQGARTRIVQNLWLALSYNAIVIPAALAGLLSPLVTTAALAVSALLIVGNCSRGLLES